MTPNQLARELSGAGVDLDHVDHLLSWAARSVIRLGCLASDEPGYDLSIHTNPDARAWARFFMETFPNARLATDHDGDVEGTMLSWFANAMMAMHDHMRGGGPLNGDHAQHLLDHPETAGAWWDQMSSGERQSYLKMHPRSSYADLQGGSARHALTQHMKKSGWKRSGRNSWTHPASRRRIEVRTSRNAPHHLVITHPNGDVVEKPTTSLRVAKRVTSIMSRPAPGKISVDLGKGAGSLHGHLGVPRGRRIPVARLEKLARSDHPLARRARLALNLQRARKRESEWG